MDIKRMLIIVTGLPRSGTSMMMQMLQAGGIELYTDGLRPSDKFNPYGYFEHINATYPNDMKWLSEVEGKAVKLPLQLVPKLPLTYRYSTIFMNRNYNDIIESHYKMFHLKGPNMVKIWKSQEDKVHSWAKGDILDVYYGDNPLEIAQDLSDYLEISFNICAAAKVVKYATV